MNKKRLNIAVSGLNATDNPGPGVAVIRAIREGPSFEGTITGLSYHPLDPGIYMQGICDDVFLLPYPSEGADNLLNRIREIQTRTPMDVILPCLDSELNAYVKIQGALADMGTRTFLPSAGELDLRSKARISDLGSFGISVPRGKSIHDAGAVFELEAEFDFPLMIKGPYYEARLARSPMEAERYYNELCAKWGLPIIIQEYIAGEEYDVVALGDGDGGLIGAVPMKKLQLTDKGKAWGGITISDDTMNDFVRDVIEKLKWRGPCEIEIIKSKASGKYYLMEFNPRFPAWCYLAVGAGQNLPWATVQLALGEPVATLPSYEVGVMFLRNSVDQIYSLSDYQKITIDGEIHRSPRIRPGVGE